ncbi:hypothetical protein YC2023_099120 [Brassica napus]
MVEEEQPVCKSERETETLSTAHNISLLNESKDNSQSRKVHLFIVESPPLWKINRGFYEDYSVTDIIWYHEEEDERAISKP